MIAIAAEAETPRVDLDRIQEQSSTCAALLNRASFHNPLRIEYSSILCTLGKPMERRFSRLLLQTARDGTTDLTTDLLPRHEMMRVRACLD